MEMKSFSPFMKMHMLAFKVPQVSQILIHILPIDLGLFLFSIYLVCGVQSVLLAVNGQLLPWRSNQVIKLGGKWQMCLSAFSLQPCNYVKLELGIQCLNLYRDLKETCFSG